MDIGLWFVLLCETRVFAHGELATDAQTLQKASTCQKHPENSVGIMNKKPPPLKETAVQSKYSKTANYRRARANFQVISALGKPGG